MSVYPDCETLVREPNKSSLLEVRRSLRSILSSLMLCFATGGVVLVVLWFSETNRLPQGLPLIGGTSLHWLWLVPAVIALEILRKRHDDLYIFGMRNVTHRAGRLSLNYYAPMVKYVDIREIAVSQDIFGRLVNYGNVELATAAQSGAELIIIGVVAPQELARLVEDLRLFNLSNDAEDDGEDGDQGSGAGGGSRSSKDTIASGV